MSGSNPLDDTAATNPTMESNEGLIAALSPESDTKSGTCLCGAFKVQFSSSVVTTIICHCHNCRKETSSMFSTWIVAPETDFTVTFPSLHNTSHGEIHRTFKQKIDSGNETTTHFCDKCSSTMYRTSTTYPGQIWIPQGAINDASLRDQKLEVEQWTSRRVPYLGGLPFTDKYTKNWTQDGTGRDEDADERRKRTEGEVYDENYIEKVERVGEGVQAKAETENEIERVERVGEGLQARAETENEVERLERVGEGVQARAETENEVERVERVGEGVQARAEIGNEIERVERVGEGLQARAETGNEIERVERVGEVVQAKAETENE